MVPSLGSSRFWLTLALFTPVHNGGLRTATPSWGLGNDYDGRTKRGPGSTSEESQSREDTAMIQNDVLLGRSNLIQLLPTKSIEASLNLVSI